jgi:hypothetical protein
MLGVDITGTIMVQAEAKQRGWLAGTLDAVQWPMGMVTTYLTIEALAHPSLSTKALVVGFVTVANLGGTKVGQIVGKRYVTDLTLEERLSAVEQAVATKGPL